MSTRARLVAAAELESFSRAATRLSVSTPALVKQVSGFEAEYGVRVFERSHAGVRPAACWWRTRGPSCVSARTP
ncbi:helix-turn-helix domain-containing protein [Paratractidigestivibacter faecalis]|uniref:helix-turn-helix domain-containing protein n=1 Tax=Paratractidigestivibacter faecalis TaxID=2292441 RepID=UPI003A8C9573